MNEDSILNTFYNNKYTINICSKEYLLETWLRELRILYTFTGRTKDESSWAVRKRKKCCFCKNISKYYLFDGYHSHICHIKHPINRGILRGGEVNVCLECFNFLINKKEQSKLFIECLLYCCWNIILNNDIIGIISTLFEKLIIRDIPRLFIDC